MRSYFLVASVLFLSALLGGCGESDANKANKQAINNNSSEISLRMAHSSEAAGDFPSAEHYYRQAMNKDSGIEPYMELADFYAHHRGERQSLAVLSEALEIEPGNTDILRKIANAQINTGAPAEALKTIDKALAIKSNDALLYNTKGVALDMLGRYTHARNAYSTALDLDPANAMLYNANLGMSYIKSGTYAKAVSLLQPIAEMPDATPQIRQNLALAYGLEGDTDNAMKYGLKDLPEKDMQENLKFYSLAAKSNSGAPADLSPKPAKLPDSVLNIPPIP